MEYEAALRERWDDLTSCVGEEVRNKWWAKIRDAYSETHRHYHTLEHLSLMFKFYDMYKDQLNNRCSLMYAIFFHDIVCNLNSQSNPQDSSAVFAEFSKETTFDQVNSVRDLIEATNNCIPDASVTGRFGEDDVHYFMDFDIAVLASSPEGRASTIIIIDNDKCYF
ncbi:unnamed protein product [Soboliphyme baturini]|uniref:HD_domain domain-containing protein n=1 Tax=Soboliphyme baturini TaxID=241478 RepID=A0A183ILX3_9BILA|nr:unnamed protein product [Soboliphyme baturini]